jgi:dTDP-4-dehydrorhamnose 3,5-epimerase
MIFAATGIAEAKIIDIEELRDERGFFARTWCQRELAAQGLVTDIAQESLSFNRAKGTMRGLHYQRPPHGEVKIVRCIRGAIYDVIVDVRPESPSYLRWEGFELTAANRRALYVPKGCLHGFLTLADDTEVAYLISAFHVPEAAGGYRHDDPAFGIVWPAPVKVISERDAHWPDFEADPTSPSAAKRSS